MFDNENPKNTLDNVDPLENEVNQSSTEGVSGNSILIFYFATSDDNDI